MPRCQLPDVRSRVGHSAKAGVNGIPNRTPVDGAEILLVLSEPESYHWSPSLRAKAVRYANGRCKGGLLPTIAETLAKLGADPKKGLTDAEVQQRLKKSGPNALTEKQKNTFAALIAYFWGPMPWIPSVLAIVSAISVLGLVVTLALGREDKSSASEQ